MAFEKLPIEVDDAGSTITIPHWGITLRRLFGTALSHWPNAQPGEARDVTVVYKGAPIATLHVRQLRDNT